MRRKRVLLGSVAAAAVAACTQGAGPDPSPPGAAPPPASLALGPCRDGDPTDQRHGSTCLCCHSDELGVAGSVDRAGPAVARVLVVDATGDVADLAPNPFANFFRHYALVPPLRVTVIAPDGRELAMHDDAPSGDCNRCHTSGIRGPD